jgi:hypothetical protein
MVCGHCGTNINPGFKTCPNCNAVYRKRAGCIGNFFGLLGLLVLVSGALSLLAGLVVGKTQVLPLGLLLLAVGGGMTWVVIKLTPYKWRR